MLTSPTEFKHIVLDQKGRALIQGTTMRVEELVLAQQAYGWSAEELQWQHPYLNLSHIHAALAYYYDHQEQLDREIAEGLAYAEQMRAQAGLSPVREKIARYKAALASRRAAP